MFIEFPMGCDSFYPPHNLSCYQTIWINNGCINASEGYPVELKAIQYEEWYNYNLK